MILYIREGKETKMKKKILTLCMSVALLLQMLPTAFAASSTTEAGRIVVSFSHGTLFVGNKERPITTETEVKYDTVSAALNDLSDGSLSTKLGSKDAIYKLDTEYSCKVLIDARDNSATYQETISEKIIISADTSEDVINTADDQVIQVNFPEIEMAVANFGFTTSTHQIIFAGGLEVQSGASLVLDNNTRNEAGPTITYAFSAPVIVNGSLKFDGNAAGLGTAGGTSGPVTFSDDATLTVANGGEVVVGSVAVTGDATSPLFKVEEGGKLNFTSAGASSYSTIETSGTAIEIAGGEVLIDTGKINATGDKPAITVGDGSTLIIPEGSNAQITTSNENGQAIDLAGGSKVQKGDTTITVGKNDGGETGGSYMDNDGNIMLGAGSSVTDSNGTTELPNGGSVDQDGDVTQNDLPAESISLNQTSVTLYSNTTPNTVQLIANVTPDNTTDSVTWSSDNEAVATVNESGLVTAVSNGSATITVTAGNVSAACTVTVTTYTSGGGSSDDDDDPTYSVTLPKNVKGGEVKTSHRYAEQGNTVTITVDPDKGYELDELTVTDSKDRELDLTDKGNGKYTFKMPGTHVEVEVSFKLVETEPESPVFADVPASAYYADAVAWAVEQGITSGTSATTFSPDMSCTRAQIVTFLWRANGSPKADGANPFTDVSADAYYYDAVLWAVKEGITSGTSAATFSPDATVTRGQTVTFLYRAAGAPAVSGGSFADVAADAYYADAVAWAVKEGVTSGTGGNSFSPDAPCTRGQIVTFMYRGVQ